MLLTTADVCVRFFLNSAILGSIELVEFLMAVLVPFALCYCEKYREHIGVDLFMQFLSPKARLWADLVTSVMAVLLYILVAVACWLFVFDTKDGYLLSSILTLQIWPWTIPTAIGFSLLFLMLGNHVAKVIKTIMQCKEETI